MARRFPQPASVPLSTALLTLLLCAAPAAADDTLAEADRLRLTGKYDEAAAMYGRLAEAEPVAAASGIAKCRWQVGKTDEAIAALSAAAAKHPASAQFPAEHALLLAELGRYDEAQQLVDAALKLDANELTANWLSAELHRVHGRLEDADDDLPDDADDGYLWLVRYYNRHQRDIKRPDDLRWIGLAAAEYARWHRNSRQFSFIVNTLYADALKLDKNYWPAHLECALLFLEKYNQRDAANELNAGLAINPNAAELHAARALLALQNYDLDQARTSIERALQINPRLIVAHHLHADLLLSNFQLREAIDVLEGVRELNPVNEDTLGRLAAAYGAVDGIQADLAGTRMGGVIDAAVKRNEHCGAFFAALGGTFDRLRKYPVAATYYEEAHQRMPQLIGVRGQLGMMYMRLGDEAKAAALLDESFKVDPFNIRVKNMRAVLEVLKDYAVLETEHFVIRFDRGSDQLLAEYAARYLEDEVYPDLVTRLGYDPQGKSLFEIFSRSRGTSGHGWFSARMVGLPYVGTVGACAGRVVALASPNDMPRKFNWARVLRHEFVHVVNLQQTDFNIPHWFTEALAVLNEDLPRPTAWLELLARRQAEDKLFDLESINLGFIRPSSSDDWTLAYAQAELYAEYALAAHGEDALARLLAAYADNLPTPAAINRAFGVDVEAFEAGYRKHLDKLLAEAGVTAKAAAAKTRTLAELERAVAESADDADLRAELAYAYLQRGENTTARKWADSALVKQAHHPLASYIVARLYLTIGDAKSALAQLEAGLDEERPQSNLLALLAALRLRSRDPAEAERLYELGRKSFPHDDQWLKGLAAVYLQSGDKEKLAPALASLAELDYDNPVICKKLAELALEREDFAAAARWANQALHVDVMDGEVHAMLGRSHHAREAFEQAQAEYKTAVELDGKRLEWRMALAQAAVRAGNKDEAVEALEALLAIDPEYESAGELLESLKP
jgi:tetratricopeptide (TPR) repeat protein